MSEENDDRYKNNETNRKLLKNGLIVFCLSCQIIIVVTNHTGPAFFNYTPPFKCKGYDETNSCNINVNRTLRTENGKNSSYVNHNGTCISGYEYLGTRGEINIVTEWNLVCDRVIYRALSVTCYFIAVAIGSLISGIMNDHYGRKFTTYFCIYTQSIVALIISAVANSYLTYVLLRFVQGLFIQGILAGSCLLINEIMPNVHRIILNVILGIFWGVGLILLAGCAFLFPNWRILNAVICVVPLSVALCSIWFIPESQIWLESRKQQKEMVVLEDDRKIYDSSRKNNNDEILTIAERSDKTKDDEINEIEERRKLLNTIDLTTSRRHDQMETSKNEPPLLSSSRKTDNSLLDQIETLFSVTTLLKRLLLLMLLWFTQTISYYSITYSLPSLAGDLYLNFIWAAFVEIFFFIVIGAATYKFGRRFACFSYLGTGFCLLSIVALPKHIKWADSLQTFLAISGKGCVIGNYICIILYTLELFPTQLRGLSLGLSHFGGLMGTITAPFAILLNNYFTINVPFLVFAILNFICSTLGFILLPETKDFPLPETVEEALLLKR